MDAASKALKWVATLAFVAAAGYVLYSQAAPLIAPCDKPLTYAIADIDSRFGISEAAVTANLSKAASVWNDAAGKTLVTASSDENGIQVYFVYSEEQRTAELGKTIDAEQAAYEAKKDEVTAMKATFAAKKRAYETKQKGYERLAARYQADVTYWNERGGAPPAEYAELQERGRELDAEREELNDEADEVNAYSASINAEVEELNVLAKKINAKVNVYNANAGEDFDQGNYVADKDGKRITIYEYVDQADLARVLAHEFGHALGIGHVENPDSIMYSFNIGEGLEPSEEDIAALKEACRLD